MSKRTDPNRQQRRIQRNVFPPMPETIRLKNMTNEQEQSEIVAMQARIQALQGKVTQLQSKIRLKQRRIRRPSWQVEKKYRCEDCGRKYGTHVALNLHLRIKHKKEQQEEDSQEEEESSQEREERLSRPILKKNESPNSRRSKSDSH